jgi:H2-forming N5,N10-methylenetetrahydromethanopterin dehydrogenase-like enzyme
MTRSESTRRVAADSAVACAVPAAVVQTPARDFVRLALEATARGFKNGLAFKRFCHRVGIPVHKTGKMLWVRPADVDAAIARTARPSHGESDSSANVQHAVEQLMRRGAR